MPDCQDDSVMKSLLLSVTGWDFGSQCSLTSSGSQPPVKVREEHWEFSESLGSHSKTLSWKKQSKGSGIQLSWNTRLDTRPWVQCSIKKGTEELQKLWFHRWWMAQRFVSPSTWPAEFRALEQEEVSPACAPGLGCQGQFECEHLHAFGRLGTALELLPCSSHALSSAVTSYQ